MLAAACKWCHAPLPRQWADCAECAPIIAKGYPGLFELQCRKARAQGCIPMLSDGKLPDGMRDDYDTNAGPYGDDTHTVRTK